jgi:hypothetical protein
MFVHYDKLRLRIAFEIYKWFIKFIVNQFSVIFYVNNRENINWNFINVETRKNNLIWAIGFSKYV